MSILGQLFAFCLYVVLSTTGAQQCNPFEADVYLPLDDDGTHLIGYPFNATRAEGSVSGALLTAGRAVVLLPTKHVTVQNDGSDSCLFDPITCENGFTLSFLTIIFAGQDPDTAPLYFVSSGAQASDSWGLSFTVESSFLQVTLNSGTQEVQARDNTYTYDSGSNTQMFIVITWDNTTLSLYRNGDVKGTGTLTARSPEVATRTYTELMLGRANSADEWGQGLMDEVLFFYSPISAQAIQQLHNNYDGVLYCLPTCLGITGNADYASCQGTNMYVSCMDETLTEHACPRSYFWNNDNSACEMDNITSMSYSEIITEVQTTPCLPDECINDPCQNGATCQMFDDGFVCNCTLGYEGGYCEIDINECESDPCLNGQCQDLIGYFQCDCDDGYNGTQCEEYDGCFAEPCAANTTEECVDVMLGDSATNFTCTCQPGYADDICDEEIDECESSPCQNNATCVDAVNYYNCTCGAGFVGTHCEYFDECDAGPCQNGGTCTEGLMNVTSLLDYTCACVEGFSGMDCEDEDECITQNVVCQNGGTCEDLEGDWNCTCASGFEGENCEIDIDECDSDPCMNGGTCTDAVNGYTCTCVEPWDGENCENYDSCQSNPCVNGQCTDLDDSEDDAYNCTCDYGYYDANCSSENECLTQNVTCLNGGECEDPDTGDDNYACQNCDQGYNGTLCENDIDDCAGQPCGVNGDCTDLVNDFSCSCTNNYIGDLCDEFNNCNPHPCGDNGSCNDLADDYECVCDEGWYGDNCTLENECITQNITCQNAGVCSDTPTETWECECAANYHGTYCEYEDLCQMLEPCENGATCTPEANDYSCSCSEGFQGRNCSEELFCITENIVCENGGTCVELGDSAECSCTDEYVGTRCEITSPCVTSPCDSVGTQTCTPTSNTARECTCYTGFSEDDCSFGPCDETPAVCNSTGTRQCEEFSNATHNCICTATYEGAACENQKVLIEVDGRYRLRQLTYTSEHADTTSETYQNLAELVTEGLSALCECEVIDIRFSAGSVVVDYTLRAAEDVDIAELLEAILTAARESTLIIGYDVDVRDITINEGTASASGSSSGDDDDGASYKVPMIIMAILLVIAVVIIVLFLVAGLKLTYDAKKSRDDESKLELRDNMEHNDDGVTTSNSSPILVVNSNDQEAKPLEDKTQDDSHHYARYGVTRVAVDQVAPLRYENKPSKPIEPLRPMTSFGAKRRLPSDPAVLSHHTPSTLPAIRGTLALPPVDDPISPPPKYEH